MEKLLVTLVRRIINTHPWVSKFQRNIPEVNPGAGGSQDLGHPGHPGPTISLLWGGCWEQSSQSSIETPSFQSFFKFQFLTEFLILQRLENNFGFVWVFSVSLGGFCLNPSHLKQIFCQKYISDLRKDLTSQHFSIWREQGKLFGFFWCCFPLPEHFGPGTQIHGCSRIGGQSWAAWRLFLGNLPGFYQKEQQKTSRPLELIFIPPSWHFLLEKTIHLKNNN